MEMVQEQRLQLTMKFLLGYNMKIVVLWGIILFLFFFFFEGGGGVFLVEEGYLRNVQMKEFQ